jgi:hypothetical protein
VSRRQTAYNRPVVLVYVHFLFGCMYISFDLWVILSRNSLTFCHRSFTFNSNKSPTWCNNFSVYYPDACLQLKMFRAFSRPSSGAQWLQWQPLLLPSYRGDSRVVFVVGPAGRSDHLLLFYSTDGYANVPQYCLILHLFVFNSNASAMEGKYLYRSNKQPT